MTTTVLERTDVDVLGTMHDLTHEGAARDCARARAGVTATRIGRMSPEQPGQCGAREGGARLDELPRRIFYAVWRVLPAWAQGLAFRVGAAKVSMGAVAVIQDVRGRVLLAHHTYRQRPWGLPGGLVGRHEQPVEAVARELREELGVAAMVGPLLYAETFLPGRHLTLYYLATIEGQPCQDGIETDDFRYVAPDEVIRLMGEEAAAWVACLQQVRHPYTRVS